MHAEKEEGGKWCNYDDIKHFLGGHTTRVAKKSIPIKDCTEKKYGVLPKGLLLKNIYYLRTFN